ncbi:hypothetical protein Tco_0554309 [Tanacetum coccineum]
MRESAKRHEENSNLIEEIRATTDAAIRNQGASIKTLEIQIGQMSKVLEGKLVVEGLPRPHQLILDKLELVDQLLGQIYKPCLCKGCIGKSSSHIIDNTDEHSFQPQSHCYRWTRDHPLEQVHGNPTMPVQTRRQLATDPEMCMFALTVSIVEPKNIKEAMADSAWIEAMQDELH